MRTISAITLAQIIENNTSSEDNTVETVIETNEDYNTDK